MRAPEHVGFWTLLGGGIDFGEDPSDAMVREVQEETGLHVRSRGIAGVDSLVVPGGGSAIHSHRIVYLTEVVGGALAAEVNGSTDLCEWHDIDGLQALPLVCLVRSGLPYLGR